MKHFRLLTLGMLLVAANGALAAKVEVIGDTSALEKRVERLERMLENPVLLQLSDRLAEQQKEIQRLQDRLDRLEYRLKQQDRTHQQRMAGLETRIAQLEAALKAQTQAAAPTEAPTAAPAGALKADELGAGAAAAAKKPEEKAARPHRPTPDELKHYDQGMTQLKKAAYKQAAATLDAFYKQYPDSALAPNAAYWAGEAYMVQLAFDKAWQRFKRVIEQHPDSNKYGDSLLRGADALIKLGKRKQARELLDRLLADKKLPASLKQRARARLEKLGKAGS